MSDKIRHAIVVEDGVSISDVVRRIIQLGSGWPIETYDSAGVIIVESERERDFTDIKGVSKASTGREYHHIPEYDLT
jgi:hypothetical protein